MTEKKRLYPIVNADVALFTLQEMKLKVLLIQRANNPTSGGWALPDGILCILIPTLPIADWVHSDVVGQARSPDAHDLLGHRVWRGK